MRRIRRFTSDQSGAVTADWVVLTASVVAFATAVGVYLNNEIGPTIAARLERIITEAVDNVGRQPNNSLSN